jgi:hypothetical protein
MRLDPSPAYGPRGAAPAGSTDARRQSPWPLGRGEGGGPTKRTPAAAIARDPMPRAAAMFSYPQHPRYMRRPGIYTLLEICAAAVMQIQTHSHWATWHVRQMTGHCAPSFRAHFHLYLGPNAHRKSKPPLRTTHVLCLARDGGWWRPHKPGADHIMPCIFKPGDIRSANPRARSPRRLRAAIYSQPSAYYPSPSRHHRVSICVCIYLYLFAKMPIEPKRPDENAMAMTLLARLSIDTAAAPLDVFQETSPPPHYPMSRCWLPLRVTMIDTVSAKPGSCFLVINRCALSFARLSHSLITDNRYRPFAFI